jgi:formylglycine-generating enzyme required for sulfatase activity
MVLILKRTSSTAQLYRETLNSEALGKTGVINIAFEMVQIPSGSFLMGSPEDESQRHGSENPQHLVTIAPFFMGRCPVTQDLWRFVSSLPKVLRDLAPDPSKFKGNNRLVENVSWHDATEFCQRLVQHTGRFYRLPTEAEWEYACRAGTTTPFHFGNTITPEVANYRWSETYGQDGIKKEKDFRGTTPIGQFNISNRFGLYDMHGNIWEWCEDHWHDNYSKAPADGSAWIDPDASEDAARVLRGGSWANLPGNCRSASRYLDGAKFRDDYYGFRLVCSTPGT